MDIVVRFPIQGYNGLAIIRLVRIECLGIVAEFKFFEVFGAECGTCGVVLGLSFGPIRSTCLRGETSCYV
jgi:hypothetical protein